MYNSSGLLSDPEPLGWRGQHAGAAHPGPDTGAGSRHVLRENNFKHKCQTKATTISGGSCKIKGSVFSCCLRIFTILQKAAQKSEAKCHQKCIDMSVKMIQKCLVPVYMYLVGSWLTLVMSTPVILLTMSGTRVMMSSTSPVSLPAPTSPSPVATIVIFLVWDSGAATSAAT